MNLSKATQGGAGDATSLRQERKGVIKQAQATPVWSALQKDLGFRSRDFVKPGTVNVTQTKYWQVLKFTDGRKMKIRERQYGFRPVGTDDPMTVVNKFKVYLPDEKRFASAEDILSFEMKFDHETAEDTTYKTLGAFLKSDASKLRTTVDPDAFKVLKKEVYDRTIAMVDDKGKLINDPAKIAAMLDFIEGLHGEMRTGAALKKNPEGIQYYMMNEYERSALERKLVDPETGKPVAIQITRDQNIRYFNPDTGELLKAAHQNDDWVLEYKEPLKWALRSDEKLRRKFRALWDIRQKANKLMGFKQDAFAGGKSSALGTVYKEAPELDLNVLEP